MAQASRASSALGRSFRWARASARQALDRPWEPVVLEEETERRSSLGPGGHGPTERLVGGEGAEHRHPVDHVVGIVTPGQVQVVRPGVEDPGGQVGALEVLAEGEERHGFVAAHGAEQYAVDPLAAGDHPAEPLHPALPGVGLVEVVGAGQPQVVDGLPRLAGDDRPGGAEVLACGGRRRRGWTRGCRRPAAGTRSRAPRPPRPAPCRARWSGGSARRTRCPRPRWPAAAPNRRPPRPAGRRGHRSGPARCGPCTRPVRDSDRPSRWLRPCGLRAWWAPSVGDRVPGGLRWGRALGGRVRPGVGPRERQEAAAVGVGSGGRLVGSWRDRRAPGGPGDGAPDRAAARPAGWAARSRSCSSGVIAGGLRCRPPRCPCCRRPGTS